MAGCIIMTSILFDQYPNWSTHASPLVPALHKVKYIAMIIHVHTYPTKIGQPTTRKWAAYHQ